jgi:beta-mannosidase
MKYFIILICFLWMDLMATFHNAQAKPHARMQIELNSGWEFRQTGETKWFPATVPGVVHSDLFHNKIIGDPFYRTNEKELQWIDKADWEYSTTIIIDQNILERDKIELVFKGLDTYATVYLNDSLLLNADNMFREWRAECRSLLREGSNELRILFRSPVKEDLPKLEKLGYQLPAVNDQSENGGLGDKKISVFARKAGYHYGWDWGPRFVTSGIWRPVYLDAWDKAKIVNLHIKQISVCPEKASLSAAFEIESTGNQSAVLSVFNNETSARLGKVETLLVPGLNVVAIDFEIQNPQLWWTNGLGEAHLYKLFGRLQLGEEVIDEASTNIGIRTLRLIQEKDHAGKSFYFELNGVPVFMKGANYIPNDNFLPSVTSVEYEEVVRAAADANMNMLRVWGGGIYENDVFYDLCDRYGLLLWHDFMFACAMYPGDDAFIENVKQEAIQNIKRLRNHPCIALWCGNNEIDAAWGYGTSGGWGWKEKFSKEMQARLWNDYRNIFHNLLPEIVRQYDDKTPYWPSSPMSGPEARASYEATSGDIHYWGVWHGKEPFESFKQKVGRFMSEYGFQSFPEFATVKAYTVPEDWDIRSEVMDAHQRSGNGNELIKTYMNRYYRPPKDFPSFLYMSQVLQAEGVKAAIEAHRQKKPYCMGTLYWQLNDCWPVASWSSMDYYRRWKALHYFAKKAYSSVLVSPSEDDGLLGVWIISDRLEPMNAELNICILNFAGDALFQKRMPVRVDANSSQCFFREDIKKLLAGMDKAKVTLVAQLVEDGKVLSANQHYFVPIKSIDLPKPTVSKFVETVDGGYAISLKTDLLAKNVCLQIDGLQGFFSDNYFDLIPGERPVVYFYAQEQIQDFENKLKITSVVDSY